MNKKLQKDTIIVGNNAETTALLKQMPHPESVLGVFYDCAGTEVLLPDGMLCLGGVDEVPAYLSATSQVRRVVCATTGVSVEQMQAIQQACKVRAVRFCAVLPVVNELDAQFELTREGDQMILKSQQEPLSRLGNMLLKRWTDFLLATIILLTAFPVVYLIKYMLAKKHHLGSVIREQQCIGPNGHEFPRYTFRPKNGGDSKGMDAFPQILNVFLGEMALVGPTPTPCSRQTETCEDNTDAACPFERRYMKSGMKGWKPSGEAVSTLSDNIQYAELWSPWLDLCILLNIKNNKNA